MDSKNIFNYCILEILYYNGHMFMSTEGFYDEFERSEDSFGFEYGRSNRPFGYESRRPGGLEHRLYSSLMESGRYAELDKAKHNEQYRNYLLANFEDDYY